MNSCRHKLTAWCVSLMVFLQAVGGIAQQAPTPQDEDREHLRARAALSYQLGWDEFGRGNIRSAIQNYLESKRLFEQAQARRDLIYILADLGTLHIYNSKYKEALEYSEQSLTLAAQLKGFPEPPGAWPDDYGVGTALSNLGNLSRRDGDYDKAVEYFQNSLAAYQRIDGGTGKYRIEILDDLADIGRTYSGRGDYLRALSFLNQAMVLARDSDREASVSNSLGILYLSQRDYSKAIDFFQHGLRLAEDLRDRFKQAELLLNLGVAFQFKREYPPALVNFGKALAIAKQINYAELMIPIYEGFGAVYKEQGKYKEALDALNEGLTMAQSLADKTRIAELFWRKAEVQLASGNATESIQTASEAVKLADQLNLSNVRYLALTTLAKAYRASKLDRSAAEALSKAIDGIEEMRGRTVGAEQGSELFFEDKVAPYREMVDLYADQKTPDGNVQALLYAERAKGRVLADVLRNGRANVASAMNEQEKAEESTLNRNIVALNVQVSRENSKKVFDAARLKNLNEQLQSARLKFETFQDSVYAAHPDLKGRQKQTHAPTLDSISQIVRDDKSAFLEYVVTHERTYLFVLTRRLQGSGLDLKVYSINISETELEQKTGELRSLIAGRDPGFADRASELYDLLVKPVEDQLKGKETVCIIPDGPLWEVPFQALQLRDKRYLLQDFALYYAPSISVLGEMSKKEAIPRSGSASLLAFGNPKLGNEVTANVKAIYRGETLAPLPEAETEVKGLRDIWGPSNSRVIVGADAGKKLFKIEAGNYKIIHLATHGILDDSNPMYSRLMMARVEGDSDDDGMLETREIMQLKLHADLVVLSACQTARGRIGAGEGVVGMSWAFLVAGVPTTVVSQWKVDSGSTARLMINFHRNLKVGGRAAKAQALRQAALELLNGRFHKHPFYWAGFVMIGDGR